MAGYSDPDGYGTYNVLDDNDPLWEQIHALNPMYRSQIDPYLTYSYADGMFGRLLGFVGKAAQSKARSKAAALLRDKLAGLSGDIFQNDYNTASSQASRQRDAGLNPDLAGEASGEAATEADQPGLGASDIFNAEPNVDVQQDLLSSLDGAMKLATGALQVQDIVSQLHLRRMSIEQQDIENADDMMTYILSKYSNIKPEALEAAFEQGVLQFGEIPTDGKWADEFNGGTIDSASISVKPIVKDFATPEARKRYDALVNKLKHSPAARSRFYDALRDMYKNRRESQVQAASRFSVDDTKAVESVYMKYLTDCHDARVVYENEVSLARSAYEQAQLGNATDYEQLCAKHNIPEARVDTETATLLAQRIQASYDNAMNNHKNSLLKSLKHDYDNGNTWAGYVYTNWLTGAPLPSLNQASAYGLMNVADAGAEALQSDALGKSLSDPNNADAVRFIAPSL